MQNQITKATKLLSENGELQQKGYATSLLLKYNREAIQAAKWRIKEWDYYLMTTDEYGVALTIADNGYMGLISISFLNFKEPSYQTVSHMLPFTMGKLELPTTSRIGDIAFKDRHVEIAFKNDGIRRRLTCKMRHFAKGEPFECDFVLTEQSDESMVIVTPFKENPKAFYYNQKIVGDRKSVV